MDSRVASCQSQYAEVDGVENVHFPCPSVVCQFSRNLDEQKRPR